MQKRSAWITRQITASTWTRVGTAGHAGAVLRRGSTHPIDELRPTAEPGSWLVPDGAPRTDFDRHGASGCLHHHHGPRSGSLQHAPTKRPSPQRQSGQHGSSPRQTRNPARHRAAHGQNAGRNHRPLSRGSSLEDAFHQYPFLSFQCCYWIVRSWILFCTAWTTVT